MKNLKFLFLTFILVFTLCNCSRNDLVTNVSEKNEGGFSLKFEKAAIPANVVSIIAVMTRDGQPTITRQLNLTGSTSAELLLTNIVPGLWHLKVNAFDAGNVVLYSGETDITILAGVLTTAELALKSTGQLQLKVTWESGSGFNDYLGNPILTELNNGSPYGPYFGRVLFDEGKFKMWFANSYGSDKYDIGYAESSDGFAWSIIKQKVIGVGLPGEWDSYTVHPGAVIKDGSVYKMYYCGYSNPNDLNYKKIGLATSTDGINWTKSSAGVVNQIGIIGYTTDIIKVNGVYYLYYGNQTVIGVATSTDGLNWTKDSQSIITANQSWEGNRIWSSSVIFDDNKFKMVYTCGNFTYFGYAESSDGLTWTKRSTPVFSFSDTSNMWPNDIRYPFIRKVNQTYYLYYSSVSSDYHCKMGVTVSSNF